MKRMVAILVVLAMLCLPVSAESAFTYLTDFDYALIRNGGTDGTFVYAAYEDNGDTYKMGLLTANGELSRTLWTAEGWNALFAPSAWTVTVHGDAGELCPYANTHKDSTLCPYLDVSLVTLTYTATGASLKEQYMYNPKQTISTGNTVHMCFGNYGYTSPETLKWDGNSTRVALRDAQGRWGVYDMQNKTMLTAYTYADMSAVYGDYAKVSNGTAWGRLDLSGATETVYSVASVDAFSVTEELREIAEGQYRVFNADNEPLSVVYQGDIQSISYAAKAQAVLVTAADGTKTLLNLAGTTIASFDKTQKVLYLDRTYYAIEQYNERGVVVGVALATLGDAPQVDETILMGDVNLDDKVDSADARVLLRRAMGLDTFTDRQLLAADLTADGTVNTKDVRALMLSII